MVSWRKCGSDSEAAQWRALLESAEDANPFQSWAWGEHRHSFGWEPERWTACGSDGSTIACLQVLKKSLPFGRKIVWAPGGPVLGFPAGRPEQAPALLGGWLEAFRQDNALVYARFRCHIPFAESRAAGFARVLSRPGAAINSGVSIRFDLTRPLEELRASMTSKHRYYVKQAEKAGLEWNTGRSEDWTAAMAGLYREMIRAKGIEERSFDPGEIGPLVSAFGEDALILIGRLRGEPVTACLILRCGSNAFYLMAATSPSGRKISAAYAMVWRLLEEIKALGVRSFDFGGIAPDLESAAGVDHFKRGFGGEIVRYLGEWDWASPGWLRGAADFLIRRRPAA